MFFHMVDHLFDQVEFQNGLPAIEANGYLLYAGRTLHKEIHGPESRLYTHSFIRVGTVIIAAGISTVGAPEVTVLSHLQNNLPQLGLQRSLQGRRGRMFDLAELAFLTKPFCPKPLQQLPVFLSRPAGLDTLQRLIFLLV